MLFQQMGPSLEDIPLPWRSPDTRTNHFYSPTSLNTPDFSTKATVMPYLEGNHTINRPTRDGGYIQGASIFPSSSSEGVCCANPICSFLVHSDPGVAWAFCCASCEFHFFSRNMGNTLLSTPCSHDNKCQAREADMLVCRTITRAQPISSSTISPAFNKSWSGVCGAQTSSRSCAIYTQVSGTCPVENVLDDDRYDNREAMAMPADEVFDDRAAMAMPADGESTLLEPSCFPQQPAFQMHELVPSNLFESIGEVEADEIVLPSTPPPPPTPPPPEIEEDESAPQQDFSMLPPPPPPPLDEAYGYAFDALPQPPPPPQRPTGGARNKHISSKMDIRSKNVQKNQNRVGIGRWRAGKEMETIRHACMPFQ